MPVKTRCNCATAIGASPTRWAGYKEVKGPGVVGEQPVLNPGENFEYTSGTPLQTPSGIMVGTYQMEDANGEYFDVDIPAFSLDSPHQPIQLN